MRKNLVVVMAGDRSLHPALSADRDFDLWVIYYGDDDAVFAKYKADCDAIWRAKGLKIELARKILCEEMHLQRQFDFEAYEYVFLPDDDIRFENGAASVSDLFEACRTIRADVFQPAIANEYYSIGWEPALRIPGAACHRTNIVELMMPGFSGEAFSHAFLPAVHALEFMRSGWGIEPVIMRLGEAHFKRALNTFVIDSGAAIHTRPVGGGALSIHALGATEAAYVPQIEFHRMTTGEVYTELEAAPLSARTPEQSPAYDQKTMEGKLLKAFLGLKVRSIRAKLKTGAPARKPATA